MEKIVSILTAGSGEIRDMKILPGTTTKQILDAANLQGYQLSRKGGDVLAADADIYNLTTDKEKLYATPEDVSVGTSTAPLSGVLKNQIAELIQTRKITPTYPINQVEVIRVRKFKPTRVIKNESHIPYWQESNWLKTSKGFRGTYKTNFGSWQGFIERNFEGNYSFYIFNPPEKLKESDHWQCFTEKGNDKYLIHFSEKPENIDSGILTIEGLISDAFKNEKGDRSWKPSFWELILGNLKSKR